ncbi:MAG: DUF6624 domain-containing protein [Rhodothermales bacterium]
MNHIAHVLAGLLFGCASFAACETPAPTAPPVDNQQLTALYEADQAERTGAIADWSIVAQNDRDRRARVQAMRDADSLHTANDFYHAAMIFQHGEDQQAYEQALELALKSVALDSTHAEARWLVAAATDRYLLSRKRPQVYGTQFVIYMNQWYLQKIDTTGASDDARRRLGARTLDETRAFLTEQNGAYRGLNIVPDSILVALGIP